MTEFFDRLEADLREAALRPPRARLVSPPAVAAVLAVALTVGAAAILFSGGDARVVEDGTQPGLSPVGTVIPKGSGQPPRSAASMVVAAGKTGLGGSWQLEVFSYRRAKGPKSSGSFTKPGPCLMLYLPSARGTNRPGLGGYCGPGNLGFRKTPGFSRQQTLVPPLHARAGILFGRAPRQATTIVVTDARGVLLFRVHPQPAPAGFKERFGFDASFYALAIRKQKGLAGARVNWWDRSGRLGSRGIRLMSPLTPLRH